MPELLRLLPVGFALGACGTLIGAAGSWGMMPPMPQPDPGASA